MNQVVCIENEKKPLSGAIEKNLIKYVIITHKDQLIVSIKIIPHLVHLQLRCPDRIWLKVCDYEEFLLSWE